MDNYPDILYLEVTQKDINQSLSQRTGGNYLPWNWAAICPISTAIKRMYPDMIINTGRRVKLFPSADAYRAGLHTVVYNLDQKSYEFICNVDTSIIFKSAAQPVRPTKLTLKRDLTLDTLI